LGNKNDINMEVEKFFAAGYQGSKAFKQLDVPTANATGFGAAADDYMERGIDLNEQLIRNKPATYFMRVSGNSMINACIHDGDIIIVDRSIKPVNGKIVIAVVDGEMIIRRFVKTMNSLKLVPETPRLSAIDVNEFSDLVIWGVVTYVIHSV
jgi:DNA polymerase V